MRKLLLAMSLALATPISYSAPLFVDSFESGSLSATNADGFRWGGTNKTGIVNSSATVFGANLFSGTGWTAKTGAHSLRFQYPATNYMSEQRFSLGRHYTEIWIGYWIRVPLNFTQGGGNNKFAAFWTNVYDGSGDVTWQMRPTSGGNAKLVVQDGGTTQYEVDAATNFINVSTDRGRWMQVAIRMRPATASGANNGIIEFYRRWSNESSYTRLYSKTTARFYEGGQGIHEGYLMGWANAPYSVDTEWLLDDFTVSIESLIDGSIPAMSSPPSAPSLQVR